MTGKTISHFSLIKLNESYWALPGQERTALFTSMAQELEQAAACASFYQVSPLKSEVDFLLWTAAPIENERDEADFFERLATAINARRPLLQPVTSLWGYTRPSMYSRGASAQEIDPLAGPRQTYLVLYPFVKTVQWYLLGKDSRQGMMNEHIRVGHQYPEIKQLLLYSFGVQDQEFVVVYETEQLYRFSELVNELRGSDVRVYTERDTPLYAGVWRSPDSLAAVFGGTE